MGTGAGARARAAFREVSLSATDRLKVGFSVFRLATGERLLDIGCGWGSKLIHAAARHGVRRVGVTLLEPQPRSLA
jgi:cyclopropane-fatty-acyl-phospholipid synthase